MLLAAFNSVLDNYQAVKQLFIQFESASLKRILRMPATLSIPTTGCRPCSTSGISAHLNQLLQCSNQTLH